MTKIVKNHVGVLVEKNAFVDQGNGTVQFPKGLVITDNSEQRNGTKYDVKSMDLSEYQGQMTADHMDMLDRTIAGVEGLAKVGNKVVVNKINYLVQENPLARLAYNLLLSPKVPTNFSIETYGSPPDEEGVYKDSKLIGLSQVVVGNNKSAKVNAIIANSIEQAKEDGLDTTELEEELDKEKQFTIEATHKTDVEEDSKLSNKKDKDKMTLVTIKNNRDFAVKVKYTNAAGDETEAELSPNQTVDVSDDQQEAVEQQLEDAEAPKEDPPKADPEPAAKKDDEPKADNALTEAITSALAPMQENLKKMEQQLFDSKAKEPKFKKDKEGAKKDDDKSEFAKMDWRDRHGAQINAAWDLLKRHDNAGGVKLNEINEVNLNALKEKGIVRNSTSIADFGNFVISPELLSEIQGYRNDYTPLIDATNWKETLSTQMAWLLRSGDISMEEVGFLDDTDNLKPISEYTAEIKTSDLMELAAVTPVCNSATRFLAADLLSDVAAGYRNDYDRKRAQLVVARIQQAIDSTGNSVLYNLSKDIDGITALLDAYKKISNSTPNGTFIFNSETHATLIGFALKAGISGPLSQIFVTGDVPTMFGRPYIVVSNDLMPGLDTAENVQYVVEGVTVTITAGLFYGDLTKFTGRTSGGLNYDLSTEAAYEVDGTVKSAYQRNELVLRGAFFRGGAILDPARFAGIVAPGIS